MEKRSKFLIIFFGGVIGLIITVATIYKAYTNHIDSLYDVVESKIAEEAYQCKLDNICKEDEITLDFLITSGYLERQINPVNKEYVSDDTIIKCNDKECKVSIRP